MYFFYIFPLYFFDMICTVVINLDKVWVGVGSKEYAVMGLFDNDIKIEALKTLITRKKYEEAVELADEIRWGRVKDVRLLCTISDLYKKSRRFEDSRDLLLVAKKRHPEEKAIVSSLCELCIRLGDIEDAEEYYKEFMDIAPDDSGSYVLKYKLSEAKEAGAEEKIAILEELKEKKPTARWLYELAKMYGQSGMTEKCVTQCNELVEQFGESKYAARAVELKNKVG